MSAKSITRKIIKVLLSAVLAVLVLAATAGSIVPAAMGWMPLTVLSSSMKPRFSPGDAMVVEMVTTPERAAEISIGDVITYMPYPNDPTVVSHRVTALGATQAGETTYTTHGDNNASPDDYEHPITHEQVRGEVLYPVPFYGHVTTLLDEDVKSVGRQLLIGLIAVVLLWQLLLAAVSFCRWVRSKLAHADA